MSCVQLLSERRGMILVSTKRDDMKLLYTSFINGDSQKVRQAVVDTGDMDLLTYVAAEEGLSLEDMMGTKENPAPINPDTWLHNEFGLFISHGECVESYHILTD